MRDGAGWLLTFGPTRCFNASLKSLHEVDDVRRLALLWRLDLLACLLPFEQLFNRVLVLIFGFLRVELACAGPW
jgi:hypothetical protein